MPQEGELIVVIATVGEVVSSAFFGGYLEEQSGAEPHPTLVPGEGVVRFIH